ncbi:hypothetical protein [Streptomyces tailanensis]|nr:hypothetical protein [Streptomyces tailanensis]
MSLAPHLLPPRRESIAAFGTADHGRLSVSERGGTVGWAAYSGGLS